MKGARPDEIAVAMAAPARTGADTTRSAAAATRSPAATVFQTSASSRIGPRSTEIVAKFASLYSTVSALASELAGRLVKRLQIRGRPGNLPGFFAARSFSLNEM